MESYHFVRGARVKFRGGEARGGALTGDARRLRGMSTFSLAELERIRPYVPSPSAWLIKAKEEADLMKAGGRRTTNWAWKPHRPFKERIAVKKS